MSYSKLGINESTELGSDNIQVSYCLLKRALLKAEHYGTHKQASSHPIAHLKLVGNDLYLMLVFSWLLKSTGTQIILSPPSNMGNVRCTFTQVRHLQQNNLNCGGIFRLYKGCRDSSIKREIWQQMPSMCFKMEFIVSGYVSTNTSI